MSLYKNINVGRLVQQLVSESGIEISRICNFMGCTEAEVEEMYHSESLDTLLLLKWSKLLEYDFFRIYSQHLTLYAPPSKKYINKDNQKTVLPVYRKNIYTPELIQYIIERLQKKELSSIEIIEKYNIPKTTLYKWMKKYIE
ncbi:Uncharacterised protein [Chryseobacterium nakagawai]|uniref:Transposase n=1 Tax=Chryseobacterium nakagawai TaxID=1241982 RepID=A0AAD0YP83_CHRNA|nr:transposase [Chryseobacterium nakagawai]AZA92502.1 transposase [Chryseobacterium nakagawai]VEH19081.1 Uncharacterised protein [Chryseobacterium nakagawai]